jgi:hypothetical protein
MSRGKRFESARRLSFFCGFAGKIPEHHGASVPRARLTYCNPPQKHIGTGGGAEEWTLFCVTARDVSTPGEAPKSLPSSVRTYDR